MSGTLPASTGQPGGAPRALRVLGLVAVCVGVAGLAAATFVLSYAGIHAIALQAGISPRLAGGYPLLLDAMLVVVLAAVLSLRGAGLPSKALAWLTLLALLGAAAGADALHAANDKLPARAAEITAAVLPWVLVFLAFALLLAMLRNARLRQLSAERGRWAAQEESRLGADPGQRQDPAQPATSEPATASDFLPGFRTLPGKAGSAAPARLADAAGLATAAGLAGAGSPADDVGPADPAWYDSPVKPTDPPADDGATAAETEVQEAAAHAAAVRGAGDAGAAVDADPEIDAQLEIGAQLEPDDPSGEEIASDPALPESEVPESSRGELSPAGPETPDPDMPVFHRISSSPVPPGSL